MFAVNCAKQACGAGEVLLAGVGKLLNFYPLFLKLSVLLSRLIQ
mgnify:CR=1